MISLKQLLMEEMTFRQLLDLSDKNRISRARGMDVRSLKIDAQNDGEAWEFSYKSNPSTTGKRHRGYIKFPKKELSSNKSAYAMNCVVDCTCPDFKYKFAYNDAQKGASVVGSKSWNKNNGSTPLPIHRQVGLCKHLIALADYLKTKMEKKARLKEGCETLNEIISECDGKIILHEGEFTNHIIKRIHDLETLIPKLEAEYDDLDDKSLNTHDVRKKLIDAQEELRNLQNLEL